MTTVDQAFIRVYARLPQPKKKVRMDKPHETVSGPTRVKLVRKHGAKPSKRSRTASTLGKRAVSGKTASAPSPAQETPAMKVTVDTISLVPTTEWPVSQRLDDSPSRHASVEVNHDAESRATIPLDDPPSRHASVEVNHDAESRATIPLDDPSSRHASVEVNHDAESRATIPLDAPPSRHASVEVNHDAESRATIPLDDPPSRHASVEVNHDAESRATIPLDDPPSRHASVEVNHDGESPATVPATTASFHVEQFAWASGCTRLGLIAGIQLDRLADGLSEGLERGDKVVAVCGCRRGSGGTTLLLCAARRLADRGLRVALVDADFDDPVLARRLGLVPEYGWEDALAGRVPLDDVLIESRQDKLTLLPLCRPSAVADDVIEDPTVDLRRLADGFDLVLIDLGVISSRPSVPTTSLYGAINAAVLVRDARESNDEEISRGSLLLRRAGIREVGVAENFV